MPGGPAPGDAPAPGPGPRVCPAGPADARDGCPPEPREKTEKINENQPAGARSPSRWWGSSGSTAGGERSGRDGAGQVLLGWAVAVASQVLSLQPLPARGTSHEPALLERLWLSACGERNSLYSGFPNHL